MAYEVKCFLHKRENLSLFPKHSDKNCTAVYNYIPSILLVESEDPQACWPATSVGSVRAVFSNDFVSKINYEAIDKDTIIHLQPPHI